MAKLYFYYSAMNAGKTTTLLQSSYNYQERGMHTLLFTPQIDDRYGKGKIASRIGLDANAQVFTGETDLFSTICEHIKQQKLHCVLVDEAQFLTKSQVIQLSEVSDQLKIPVLTYGLRSDFQGEPFEGSKYLLAWAEEIMEIKTICHCGSKATMNMRVDAQNRKVTEGAQVEIGGNDRYIATCHKHFKQGVSQQSATSEAKAALA